jgi:serine/threonine protein kinase
LYELLAGSLPFEADNTLQLCVKVLHERVDPLRSRRPDLPEGLCQAIERCLSKDREARFANVGELALALLPYAPQRAKPSVERIIRTVSAANGDFADVLLQEPASEQTSPPHVVDQITSTQPTVSRPPAVLLAITFISLAAVAGFALAQRLAPAARAEEPKVFVIENAAHSAPQQRSQAELALDLRAASSAAASIVIQLPVTTGEPKPQATATPRAPEPRGAVTRKPSTRKPQDETASKAPEPKPTPNVFETRN